MEIEKKYSAMTEHELRTEIGRLLEKARKAEQLGIVNEYAGPPVKNGYGTILFN